MAAEAFISNKPRRNFPGMQRDANFGIEPMKKIDHSHLQRKVGHRDVDVFGHYEINPGDARINRRHFEPEQRLREYLLFRKAAKHLIKEANFNMAAGQSIGLSAMLALISKFLSA